MFFSSLPHLTASAISGRLNGESGWGPVVLTVFKIAGRRDERRRWVRLPRTLASTELAKQEPIAPVNL